MVGLVALRTILGSAVGCLMMWVPLWAYLWHGLSAVSAFPAWLMGACLAAFAITSCEIPSGYTLGKLVVDTLDEPSEEAE